LKKHKNIKKSNVSWRWKMIVNCRSREEEMKKESEKKDACLKKKKRMKESLQRLMQNKKLNDSTKMSKKERINMTSSSH
jgi:hypothetical protein